MKGMTVELQRKPRKYNRSLCIGGVDFITSDVLKEAGELCKQYAANEQDKDLKFDWSRLKDDIADVLENGLCPDYGVKILGPFMIKDAAFPDKGESVFLMKGTEFSSTHPDPDMESGVLSRKQKVKVSSVHGGYIDRDREVNIVDPSVNWAGTGGYWRWTSVANIEGNKAI